MASSYTNDGVTYETFGTTSPVTGSAPTLATDGQPLKDLNGLAVSVSAGAVNLSGAGSLQGYLYDPAVGVWARASFLDLSVTASGIAAQVFEPFDVIAPRNARVKWIPSGVTFASGSAGVTVYQLGFCTGARGNYP